jgi:hypothetical protein
VGTLKTIADALIKAYHASPRFMAVMCVVCAVLLFLPARFLGLLSVEPVLSHYRPHVGMAFVFFLVMTISYPTSKAWNWSSSIVRRHSLHKHRIARLHALDNREKKILKGLVGENI